VYPLLLGVTGSISAYKTPELIRRLIQASVQVFPVLSRSAPQFVTPLSLETVSGNSVRLADDFTHSGHIQLAKAGKALVIAPASANCISKCANGVADDLLSSLWLSFRGPKMVVPAMHAEMWENPAVGRNIALLKQDGVKVLGPDYGHLACNDVGVGRLVDLDLIVLATRLLALKPIHLKGKKMVITAGGTTESLDSVRVLTNKSTGVLGQTLAHCAAFFGAEVTLISTRSVMPNPELKKVVQVSTVSELSDAVQTHFKQSDLLVMAAAVSDFTVTPSAQKINRNNQGLSLDLKPTEDIVKSVALSKNPQQKIMGFCLEEAEVLEKKALEKLEKKQLDWIVANTPLAIGAASRTLQVYKRGSQAKKNVQGDVLSVAYELLQTIAE